MQDALHPAIAAQWLAFLKSPQAQTIYRQYGFRSIEDSSKWEQVVIMCGTRCIVAIENGQAVCNDGELI